MTPKVAILLPCHNSLPYLKDAVESIFNSTKFPLKLILIESESTDGTAEYCDSLIGENVEVYHTKKEGLQRAFNFGMEKSEGLDVYLTQDDVIHFKLYGRDWLEEMHDASKNEKIGMITTLDGGGISGDTFLDGLQWAGTWSTYIPRRTIIKIGTFDTNINSGDDIDYSYRVYLAGLCLAFADFWVQHHRKTEHGTADDPERIIRNGKRFKEKWGLK